MLSGAVGSVRYPDVFGIEDAGPTMLPMKRSIELRKLEIADMGEAAVVYRTAFDNALPTLTGLHTPDEDRRFFQEQLFKTCDLWGAFDRAEMIGIIAFREDWIDQLYVLPKSQRLGVGTELLQVAQRSFPRLHLWTFQCNARARRFYEKNGFALVKNTDGTGNEEMEPDALYRWMGNPIKGVASAWS